MRKFIFTFILLLVVLVTGSARACPVCEGADRNDATSRKTAVYVSTGAMVLLPLGMTTGLFLWLRKR